MYIEDELDDYDDDELLPIDQETGEIDYDRVQEVSCPVFFVPQILNDLEDLTFAETIVACILGGIFMFLVAAIGIGLFWLLRLLFAASPILFYSLASGTFAMLGLVIVAKLRKKLIERKSDESDENDGKA